VPGRHQRQPHPRAAHRGGADRGRPRHRARRAGPGGGGDPRAAGPARSPGLHPHRGHRHHLARLHLRGRRVPPEQAHHRVRRALPHALLSGGGRGRHDVARPGRRRPGPAGLLAAGLAARLPARAGEADHPRDGAPAPRSQPLGCGAAVGLRWDDWGEAAFARARETGRPLLLSLTARWCGACHRMDEETWDDPGVAARVAEVAVPVRVDADARPDVYGRYHLGGLPTTALLTADGDFLRGGTFLSPTQLFGLLDAAAADLREGRRPAPRPRPAAAPGRSDAAFSSGAFVDEVVARLVRRADREHGGFGGAPKHPEPDAVTLLLREARRRPDAAIEAIAREALDAIARHLVDPADGAFFRYGAADDWTGPHTEKVTLDQAALIRLFLEAERALGDPAYGAVALRALAHARAHLMDAAERVYASIAAQPDAEVDMRRFADASAALASALLAAGAGSTPGSTSLPPLEFIAAAPDGAVPHRLDAPDAAGPRGLLRDQALAISAAVHAYRAAGDR